MMDASTLSALIDASSEELAQLHKRLGCPPEELEKAMADLKACIRDAIHAQVHDVQTRVEKVEETCRKHEERIQLLCKVTGATHTPPPSSEALLAQQAQLAAEQTRLESLYESHRDQCDLVLSQAKALNECMSQAGGEPTLPPDVDGMRNVTPDTLRQLEAYLHRVQDVYKERKLQMEAQITEILQLWSELHIMPEVTVHAGRAVALTEQDTQTRFHLAILEYTQQVPVLDADKAFHGQFDPMPLPASSQGDATPDLLQPTNAILEQSVELRTSLEREKSERESNIQSYYDELCELWMRFDVPETEMDAFVLDHRGSTLDVVEAYRTELEKMRVLKTQHMALFIAKTREQIWEQWDALYMSEAERESSFPAYFLTLPSDDDLVSASFDWDELLAQHEAVYTKLTEMLEQRAPILQLIGRYRAICDEARALEESAQDGTRLLGRGNRGDPGRLLREEKMRKRVKVQKPKLEQELLKVLPNWEAEHNMPFLMDGVRFIDYLRDQLGGAKENPRSARRPGAPSTDRLGASRTANHVPSAAASDAPLKRPPTTRPVSVAATHRRAPMSASASGPGATRGRTASQSRTAPYHVASTPSAKVGVPSSASTLPDALLTPPSHTSSAASLASSTSSHTRTPSSLVASSLSRAHTPALPRW